MTEQFIQDTAANRTQKIAELLAPGWTAGANDVVTVEYTFRAGRVDIVATFNNRKGALLIEVKQGEAGKYAIDQVSGYAEQLRSREENERLAGGQPQVVELRGVVIAEAFAPGSWDHASRTGVDLVEFQLRPGQFPFRIATSGKEPEALSGGEAPAKTSQFLTLKDHVNWIQDDGVRQSYQDFAHLFLQPDSDAEAREWLYQSIKVQHVAVRYKGDLVLCLFARRRTFHFGYSPTEGQWEHVGDFANVTDLGYVRERIRARIRAIDEHMRKALNGFRWT